MEKYLPAEQVAQVMQAYEFAAKAHEGQQRYSGEPYISHPVAVATILAELKLDAQTLMAALLHDVIEDTGVPKADIATMFGAEVAELVDGVSKLDKVEFRSRAEAQAESFRKMLFAMVGDMRVILVKLADRTHNMRTLWIMPPEKRRRIARETLEIYAPIANRLGMNAIRLELEDLGFRCLYPNRYRVLERALKRAQGNQKQVLQKIGKRFEEGLGEARIEARVAGREKHIYSIYRKMREKKRALNEIVDVYGIRIIVESVDDCYRALGVVHKCYKPMPGRFKDYIAIPRVNGYQSLHTTLFGPGGLPCEVQIRTDDMDHIAESGIAAHWLYKSGSAAAGQPQVRAREWLASLMEMEEGGSSEEFLESVKIDLFPDKTYVFTPKGDIVRLPRGATCVDFAYAVHTGVGNRCVAARVDRRPVPLRTVLKNGQTVQIVTARGASPNPAWVNFVVTAKARTAIRSFLKNLQRSEAADLGRRLLDNALREFKLTVRKVPAERMQATLDLLGCNNVQELYEQIGLGERMAALVARRLLPDDTGEAGAGQAAPLAIAGTEGMVVTYGRCCHPIPGDTIFGYLSAGRGIVIHREDCGNLAEFRKQPDKWVAVEWESRLNRTFPVEIRAEVQNRLGVLAAVAANISSTQTNIEHVQVVERDGDSSSLIFLLQVDGRDQLERVLRSIRTMAEVLSVARTNT
ncbi:bifunctional (p)ppGpp synthetase/guanosine-3',5'-bis(diphosphate) 3'-pyrophosphohydrolase [Thioalkalivibrio sp. XN8]|nr:bifunctional (p)ppGpp synthetase/guanosine-3',5'-bis(diphosphate) 3'-pyrophosphohydrolase [Thioalkalivibrio sp. XN8]NGP52382.1 bifunctional (p)ppGpp synthetase/guanosine-3',5'-bis(diphosphate) 3'-pyrophosphohydrolase [Thioalkalivibrio sp. XN8]